MMTSQRSVSVEQRPSTSQSERSTTSSTASTSVVDGPAKSTAQLGRVKWFNLKKGWGFISPIDRNECAEDVFVYQSSIEMEGFRKLHPDQLVQFEYRVTGKGAEATKVVPFPSVGPREGTPEGMSMLELDFGKIFGLDKAAGHPHNHHRQPRDKLIKCFNCGKFGHHKAFRCTIDQQKDHHHHSSQLVLPVVNKADNVNDVKSNKPKNIKKRCHQCRSEEHLAADCPGVNKSEAFGYFTINLLDEDSNKANKELKKAKEEKQQKGKGKKPNKSNRKGAKSSESSA